MAPSNEDIVSETADADDDSDDVGVHVFTAEREQFHLEQARKIKLDREASLREVHRAFLAVQATATAAEAAAAKATVKLAQDDEQVDCDVVNAVAEEAELAAAVADRARDASFKAQKFTYQRTCNWSVFDSLCVFRSITYCV